MVKFPGGQKTRAYSALLNSIAYVAQNGVKSGCLVTQKVTPDMGVAIASGEVFFATSNVNVSAVSSLSVANNNTSFNRIDVVRVNNSGVVSVVTGVAGAVPLTPEYDPDNFVCLAVIVVPPNASSILNVNIIDGRALNTSGGASGTSFTGLSDTPSSLVGDANKVVVVKNDETGLEVTLPFGFSPIGSVTAWLKSYTNTPSLPSGWVECNGQTLNDSDSPYNGQVIPDLNGENRFLRGNATSGDTGDGLHNHQWASSTGYPISGRGFSSVFTNGGTGQLYQSFNVNGALTNFNIAGPNAAIRGTTTIGNEGYAYTDNQEAVPKHMNVVWVMRIK